MKQISGMSRRTIKNVPIRATLISVQLVCYSLKTGIWLLWLFSSHYCAAVAHSRLDWCLPYKSLKIEFFCLSFCSPLYIFLPTDCTTTECGQAAGDILKRCHAGIFIGRGLLSVRYARSGGPATVAALRLNVQGALKFARITARRDVGEGQLGEERFPVKGAAATEVLGTAH